MTLKIHRLQSTDIPAAAEATAAAFEIDISDEQSRRRWEERINHSLQTDPGGAFLAARDGELIGVAQAIQREHLWCLSLLAVRPGVQSGGAGRALMRAALAYGDSTHGLIPSSNDPRALRLYRLAGFALLPTFEAQGAVERRALPRPDPAVKVNGGGEADLEALEPISRDIRGAPHTREIQYALSRGARLLFVPDRGFAVVEPGHSVWLLVARDDGTATALLWSTLALVGETQRPVIRWITAEQQWAIGVALAAGLKLSAYGALSVRGRPGPLRPFLPSGPFA